MAEKSVRNQAEWISLGVSLTLLAGVVATVVTLWLHSSDQPAQFTVERGDLRTTNEQYYLPITVRNQGDITAAQVTVEGMLSDAEISMTTFDFVPGRSDAKGVLIFDREPSAAKVRVVSYQEP
ncbi:MAG: hypothetical protein WBG38_18480 [Nodosilinea sp.]